MMSVNDFREADQTDVQQILLTMPPSTHLISQLLAYKQQMAQHRAYLGLMIDNVAQLHALAMQTPNEVWRIYIKLDIGSK